MHFLLQNLRRLSTVSIFSGPTPIHAPRPGPISYSVGVGTSDFGAPASGTETQGGPPPLELSSFLRDLPLDATSSPTARTPVTVLSPNFRQYLEAGSGRASPVRIALSRGTSARVESVDAVTNTDLVLADKEVLAVVEAVDVAIDTGLVLTDKEVLAVVGTCTACTEYCPPIETASDANLSETVADVTVAVRRSSASLESFVDPPDDFTVDESLVAGSEPDDVGPALEGEPEATSPLGPSLIDSDDEPIASHLPGYLNSFKTCEVSDQRFLPFIFSFRFPFSLAI